jgi:hypothetical protein
MARTQLGRRLFDEEIDSDESLIAKLTERATKDRDQGVYDQEVKDRAFSNVLMGENGQFAFETEQPFREAKNGNLAQFHRDRETYNKTASQVELKYGDVLPIARTLFSKIKEEDVDFNDVFKSIEGLDQDEVNNLAILVAKATKELPEAEQKTIWDNFTTQAGRDAEGLAGKFFRGTAKIIIDGAFPEIAPYQSVNPETQREIAEAGELKQEFDDRFDASEGFLAEMLRLRDEVNPVLPLTEDSGFLGAAERALYATPGVGVSIGLGIVPVVGQVGTLGMLERTAYSDIYLRSLDGTGDRKESARLAGMVSGHVAASQYLFERIGLKGVTGKLPKLTGFLNKLPVNITGKVARVAVGTGGRTTVEQVTEEVQEIIAQAGNDVVNILNEEVEGGDWDQHWENFGQRNLTGFLSILPYAGLGTVIHDGGIRNHVEVAKGASDLKLEAAGYKEPEIRAFRAAKNPAAENATLGAMIASQDASDPSVAEKIKKLTKEYDETTAKQAAVLQEIQNSELAPRIVTTGAGTVNVLDDKTGEIIKKGATPQEAAAIVGDILNFEDRERSLFIEQLATQIEGAQVLAKERGDGEKEIMPLEKLNEAIAEERFKGSEQRFSDQSQLMERLDGGTGDVSRAVWGASLPLGYQGRKSQVDQVFAGSSLFTVIHEHTHETRRRMLSDGSFPYIEQVSELQRIDTAMRAAKFTEFKDGKKVEVPGSDFTFLPDNFADLEPELQETAVDEAMSQLAEVLILRTRGGKKVKFRELLNRNLSAQVKLGKPGAGKLKAFVRAMRDWFGLNLRRSVLMKKLERNGDLDSAQIDDLQARIMDSSSQAAYESEVKQSFEELIDPIDTDNNNTFTPTDDVPFSISPAQDAALPSEIAQSSEPLVEQIYLKETDKFQKLMAEGKIKTEADFSNFIDKHMVMHQPDSAMSGEVKVDGESFVKGKGGVYYPILFSEEGYFWASTAAKADEMADALNEIGERNGGKIYMALTSADVDKLFSSTTMSVGTMNFFKRLTKNAKKYGITEKQLNSMLIKASKTEIVSKILIKKEGVNVLDKKGNKTYKTKIQNFGYKLPEGSTLNQNIKELEGWLQPFNDDKSSGSSFDVRKSFVFDLMRLTSTHLNARPDKAAAVSKLLTSDSNKFAKSKVMKGELSMSAFQQGLGDMLSEPLTKTFQQFGAKGKGYIYAIIEIEGKVKAIDTNGHESYPKAIVSVDGKKPVVHVMKKAHHWTDVVQEKDSGARIPRTVTEMNKVYPTGGFSAYKGRPLQFGKVQKGAESVELSYSLGDSAIADSLMGDVSKRVKSPEALAKIMGEIKRRLDVIKIEADRMRQIFGKEDQKVVVDPRAAKSLKKEGAMRQAKREEELINEVWERYGNILGDEVMEGTLTKLREQPLHAALAITESNLKGRLMSKTQAIKSGKYDPNYDGDYDGADGINRTVFGGSLMPDQAAQELFDDGLLSDPDIDLLWEELSKEQESVSNRKEELKVAKDEIREAKKQARAETQVWFNEQGALQERDQNPMDRLRRSLAMLDAILLALPIELRGRVGGFVQLANLPTDEARLKYLHNRIDKIEAVIETWLKKEFDKSAKELFARASPTRQEAGKIDRGKHDYLLHQLFSDVKASMELSEPMVKGLVKGYETTLEELKANGILTPQEETQMTQRSELVNLFGNWKNADAATREAAIVNGWRIFNYGFTRAVLERIAKREALNASQGRMIKDSGKKGDPLQRDKMRLDEHTWNNFASKMGQGFMDFGQALGWTFGQDSKESERLEEWERQADYQKKDRMFDHQTAIESFWTDLKGDPVKGLKAQYEIQTATTVIKGSSTGGRPDTIRELTQGEMIQARMMWRQPDGMRHMQGHEGTVDQEGTELSEPTKWAYTSDFMDQIDKNLNDDARALERFLTDQYALEYDSLNAVHERVSGISLPKNLLYSPLTVAPSQGKTGDMIDPLSGQVVSEMNMSPTSIIRRSQSAIAEPRFLDALHTFYGHKTQIEHWMAYAEFSKEMSMILNNRDVRNSVEAKSGNEGLNTLNKWQEIFAKGGVRDSAMTIAAMQGLQRGMGRAAQAALVGRVSVLAIQSTQLGAALAHMPTGSYLKRVAKLASGRLGWGATMRSEFIQRRIKDAPPAVRMAMEQMRTASPSKAKYLAHKMGNLISGADAFFTAATYAIIYDYQTTALKLSPVDAHAQAEKLTEEVAQPVRSGKRSLFENVSKNPFVTLAWAFASEGRQKIMLAAYTGFTGRTKSQKARALAVTWGFGGAMAAVIRAMVADIRDGEDDELLDEKYWNPARLSAQTLAGPFSGFPIAGDFLEGGTFALWKKLGMNPGYLPEGNLLDSIPRAAKSADRMTTNALTSSEYDDIDTIIKDVDTMVNGVAPFNDSAAAYSSFIHLGRDLFRIGKNVGD